MICDKCKKEIVGFFIFERRFRKDLILCQNCYEKKKIKKSKCMIWKLLRIQLKK